MKFGMMTLLWEGNIFRVEYPTNHRERTDGRLILYVHYTYINLFPLDTVGLVTGRTSGL